MEEFTLLNYLSGTNNHTLTTAERAKKQRAVLASNEYKQLLHIIKSVLALDGLQICVVFGPSEGEAWCSAADVNTSRANLIIVHDSTSDVDVFFTGSFRDVSGLSLQWDSTKMTPDFRFPVQDVHGTDEGAAIKITGRVPYLDDKTSNFDKGGRLRDLRFAKPLKAGVPDAGVYDAQVMAQYLQAVAPNFREREYIVNNTNIDVFVLAILPWFSSFRIWLEKYDDASMTPFNMVKAVEQVRNVKRERVERDNTADDDDNESESIRWQFENNSLEKTLRLFPSRVQYRSKEWAQLELLTQSLFNRWELSVKYFFISLDHDNGEHDVDAAENAPQIDRLQFEKNLHLIPAAILDRDGRYKSDHWLDDFEEPDGFVLRSTDKLLYLHEFLGAMGVAVKCVSSFTQPWQFVYWNRNPNDKDADVNRIDAYIPDYDSDDDIEKDDETHAVFIDAMQNPGAPAPRAAPTIEGRTVSVQGVVVETPGPLLSEIIYTVLRAFATHMFHEDLVAAKTAWYEVCVPWLITAMWSCFTKARRAEYYVLNLFPSDVSLQPAGVLQLCNFVESVVVGSNDVLSGFKYETWYRVSEFCSPTALVAVFGEDIDPANAPDYISQWREAYFLPQNFNNQELIPAEAIWTMGRLFEFIVNGKISVSENVGPWEFYRAIHVEPQFPGREKLQTMLRGMLTPNLPQRVKPDTVDAWLADYLPRVANLPARFIERLVRDRNSSDASRRIIERLAALNSSNPASDSEEEQGAAAQDDLEDVRRPAKRRGELYGKRALANSSIASSSLPLDLVVDARTGETFGSLDAFPEETGPAVWLLRPRIGTVPSTEVIFFGSHKDSSKASESGQSDSQPDYEWWRARHLRRRRAVWALLDEPTVSRQLQEYIRDYLFADFSISKTEPRATFEAWTRTFDTVLPRILAELA